KKINAPKSQPQPSYIELEITVNDKVSEGLRQMMLLPTIHTEYRQFLVLHDKDPPGVEEKRRRFPTQRIKDLVRTQETDGTFLTFSEIEHVSFDALIVTDKATFGELATQSVQSPAVAVSSARYITAPHATAAKTEKWVDEGGIGLTTAEAAPGVGGG
ncbi:10397_t:CDS:2, partial [Acaulospora colombiana]